MQLAAEVYRSRSAMLSGTIRLMVSLAPRLTFHRLSSRCTLRCFSVRLCCRSP